MADDSEQNPDRPTAAPPESAHGGLKRITTAIPVDHDGTTIYLNGVAKGESPGCPVIIVHGLGEKADLYDDALNDFASRGHSAYCYDLRGHGRSRKRHSNTASFKTLVKDLLQVAAWVRHREQGRSPVVLGHGVGALITIEFANNHEGFCCGLAITGLPIAAPRPRARLRSRSLKVFAELFPAVRMPIFPKAARLLNGPDRKGKVKISAKFAAEMVAALERFSRDFVRFQGPTLLLCPANDPDQIYAQLRRSAATHSGDKLEIIELEDMKQGSYRIFDDRQVILRSLIPWLRELSGPGNKTGEEGASTSGGDLRIQGEIHGAEKDPDADLLTDQEPEQSPS